MAKRKARRKGSVREKRGPGGRRSWWPRGILLSVLGLGLSVAFLLWSTGDVKISPPDERRAPGDAEKPSGNAAVLAEQWLTAVAEDNKPTALARAQELCNSIKLPMPDPAYVALAEHEGLPGEFLSGPFNAWDYQRWKYSYFLNRLSETLSAQQPDDVRALFATVCERISPAEKAGTFAQPPWPYRIWKVGVGVCDRQAWLLCELAYQRGWETQVIYLMDPQINDSPHTVCELRKGGQVWLADPFKRVLLERTSIDDVVENPELIRKTWANEQLERAFQWCILWTPSYPQSYCPRNQVLYSILKACLKDRCPRFGEDPKRRMETYVRLRAATERKLHFEMRLWDYPLRLLKAEINLQTASPAS
jgi:hypothetical protein